MEQENKLNRIYSQATDSKIYKDLHWEGSFSNYLDRVSQNPRIIRNSYQRIYEMIVSQGTENFLEFKQDVTKYKFFDDPLNNGRDRVYGLDKALMQLVSFLKSAAFGYGAEKRILLLHGPVGSAKSTIVRTIKKGLEAYSKTDDGQMYTFAWKAPDILNTDDWVVSPMNEEPLKLLPIATRKLVLDEINTDSGLPYNLNVEGELNPFCRFIFDRLLEKYEGNWRKVIDEHIKIVRLIVNEEDRVGIGTFQPKDEKNQDSTELTGDINYRKIAIYGSDTDPRAFNFDGEFCIANRGLIEFVEILKLDVAFLYDLLGASQEHVIKPKKFAQTAIDEVIIGHTNEPEYLKLQNNELMEAFRDRTVKIDIPYNTKLDYEVKIYEKDFNKNTVKHKHIAPHTTEVAAMWAVLTRLEEPKKAKLTMIQKMKLYNGKTLPKFTEDNIKELKTEAPREGMVGISPRYIQDKISAVLAEDASTSINPFMLINELESGLDHYSLLANDELKKHYIQQLGAIKQEYEDIIKNEVQRAIIADEEAISRLCSNYIDNLKAYTQREKIKNKYTGKEEEPDERLMRSIEQKIDIQDSQKDDFRREIMNYIAALALDGKKFDWKTNERLSRAFELKLFEDQKDQIKLRTLVTQAVDKETQEKIEVVKTRLIRDFGYNDESATDVLNFVASIFARGDAKQN